eukprot:SAG11_NODE_7400_length_1149_cov_1.442857_1_plen_92_part_10
MAMRGRSETSFARLQLGDMEAMDLNATPAKAINPSAVKCGWLAKEGTKGTSGVAKALQHDGASATESVDVFKRRWFVLWRHPDRSKGAFNLL